MIIAFYRILCAALFVHAMLSDTVGQDAAVTPKQLVELASRWRSQANVLFTADITYSLARVTGNELRNGLDANRIEQLVSEHCSKGGDVQRLATDLLSDPSSSFIECRFVWDGSRIRDDFGTDTQVRNGEELISLDGSNQVATVSDAMDSSRRLMTVGDFLMLPVVPESADFSTVKAIRDGQTIVITEGPSEMYVSEATGNIHHMRRRDESGGIALDRFYCGFRLLEGDIWFPFFHVTLTYAADGGVNTCEIIDIKSAVVNSDLKDQAFTIAADQGVVIFDRRGLGAAPAPSIRLNENTDDVRRAAEQIRQQQPFREALNEAERNGSGMLVRVVVVNGILVVVLAIVVAIRRRLRKGSIDTR